MPATIQIRRGLDSAVGAVSGAAGEPLFTTDAKELWVCDGGGTGKTKIGPFDPSDYAPLASPALTGTPTAPTAAPGTDTTQIATTAFVAAALTWGAFP